MTATITREDTVRAALYQRVSTKDQQTDRQNRANREVAAREGWAATEYEDKVGAGRFTTKTREDYERLLAEIKAGRVDVLVFWESSRGGRELEGWAHLLKACRARGVLIHVTNHQRTYDVRIGRDWKTLAEDGVRSEDEINLLSERVTDGKRERAAMGVPQGSIAYGVRRVWDPAKPKLNWVRDEPHPDTGPIAAEIIRRVGDREAFIDIARDLNARGIPSPKGGQWARTSVVRIADNPVYVGAGVVTQKESNAAKARIIEGKGQGSGSGERPNAAKLRYSGCMKCSICGEPVQGHCPYYDPAGRYQCKGTEHTARTAKGTAWISAARADQWIDELAIKWLSQPVALALLEAGDDSGAREALDEAEGYDLRVAEAKAKAESGDLDPDELMLLAAAVKGWARKAAEARERAEKLAMPSPLAGLPDEDEARVRANWEALTIGARKAAIRVIAPNMVLRPGSQNLHQRERIIPWPETADITEG
jgi:site-specific DNA recombinase